MRLLSFHTDGNNALDCIVCMSKFLIILEIHMHIADHSIEDVFRLMHFAIFIYLLEIRKSKHRIRNKINQNDVNGEHVRNIYVCILL